MGFFKSAKPKRVLCTFDYGDNCMTGYATVSRNVVAELKKHFGNDLLLDIVAVNYFGPDYTEYEGTVAITSGKTAQKQILGTKDTEQGDNFGRYVFLGKLKQLEYDAIFIISDLGTIIDIVPFLRSINTFKKHFNKKQFKTIFYFPVDGKIHSSFENKTFDESAIVNMLKSWGWNEGVNICKNYFSKELKIADQLKYLDFVVTYTEFARQEILKHDPSLAAKLKYIYHGINLKDFFPIPKNEIKPFRDEYFGENSNKYIVGVINRNQFRKDIPTSILGFIEAKKNWGNLGLPEPFLYLHMKPDESDYMGWNLPALLKQTNLVEGKDYMFCKGDGNGQVDVQTLNKIYNSIDVYLSTANGGGWELVSTEMFACKIPCIQPNHTSLGETGANGRSYLLKEFLPIVHRVDCVIRDMCHVEEVGEEILQSAINKFYSKEKHQKIIDSAYQWIVKLTWADICKKWIEIFEKL